MATVPTVQTYTAGSRWRASDANTLANTDKAFWRAPPLCIVYATAGTTLTAAGTLYPITYDSETFDNDGMHSTSVNTSRLTAVTAGYYLVTGYVGITQQAAVSYIGAGISKNGATPDMIVAGYVPTTPNTTYGVTATHIVYLAVNDYVELRARSGTAGVVTAAAAGVRSYLEARWIGA